LPGIYDAVEMRLLGVMKRPTPFLNWMKRMMLRRRVIMMTREVINILSFLILSSRDSENCRWFSIVAVGRA